MLIINLHQTAKVIVILAKDRYEAPLDTANLECTAA